MENQTIANYVKESREFCSQECIREPCNQIITFTDTNEFYYPSLKSIKFSSMVPSAPGVKITSKAVMMPLDFVLYISNSLGFWFGVSVMSLHSIRWRKLVSKSQALPPKLCWSYSFCFDVCITE